MQQEHGRIRSAVLCAVLTAQLVLAPGLGVSARAAGGVRPDPNAPANKRPGVDSAPNGVPVVNITAANGAGLSHNQYHDFNVGRQGLILNNSSDASRSQLGGILPGNPQFHGKRGAEARTILNEVTSANRSRIEGYIEVNGRTADVILANPNGVTVNGGGYINVPRATITTGSPQVGPDGALRGYEVRRGDVRIEGAGINADNLDAFTLLSRTASVEAQMRAKDLTVVTGANRVGADGTVTPLEGGEGERPQVGIDSSALGGMYANRITLVATEKGVGVNLEGTVQSADQMVITADGKLRLREAASGGDAALSSAAEVRVDSSVMADRDLQIAAPRVSTPGVLAAGRDLTVQAQDLSLENGAQLAAGVDASGGLTKDGNVRVAVGKVEARQADILSGGSVDVSATEGIRMEQGRLAARKDMALAATELDLTGGLVQADQVKMVGQRVSMRQKAVAEAFTDLVVQASVAEVDDANLSAGLDMLLDVGRSLFDPQATLSAGNDLFLRGTEVTLEGAFLAAGRDLEFYGEKLSNLDGVLYAARDQRLLASDLLLNDGGEIYSGNDMLIAAADGKGENVVRNLSGVMSAGNGMVISARSVENKKREFEVAERGKHVSYNSWYECNKALLGHGCDRRQLWFYVNVYEDYILKDSPSAQILAGGDIGIEGDLLENHYSTIAAGNNLVVRTKATDNREAVLQRTRTVRETMKGWDSDGDFTNEYFRDYKETFEEIGRAPAVLSAMSDLYMNVEGTFANHADRQGIALPSDHAVGTDYPFAGSPMFRPVSGPGHHYLIETNPALTNLGIFYGSDYFLSRIGLDQRQQQITLLGDAFFETRLVQQQILEATGRRFLAGYSTDADQMRGLMDAAAAQAEGLDLALGVALTPTQVAALTQDMVWLVEEEHMGQKVLVPRLYLASATQQDMSPGGVQAKNVYITAGQAILNEGRISGENVNLASVNIKNTGGLLRGGNMTLSAQDSIVNDSGFLRGGEISLKAGGDIVSRTLSLPGQGNAANRHVQAQGSIQATGSVTAVAGRDLSLLGSSLNAGGDVSLVAGKNMTIGTVTEEFHLDGGSRSQEHRVTHTGSTVLAGGDLRMLAGQDMTLAGSQAGAGGNALLAAGGNLSVVAVQDTFSSFVKAESGKGGLFSSSSKSTYTQDFRTSKGSTVAAGGDLALLAGARDLASGASGASGAAGHVSVVGSALVSGKDLSAAAGGNINVTSAVNSRFTSYSKSSSGALGLSSSSKKGGSTSVTRVSSTLAGQNISLEAGQDVNVGASRLAAADTLSLTAREGSVTVMDGQNLSSSWEVSSKTGFGLGGGGSLASIYGTEGKRERSQTSSSVASVLTAGQDVTLSAARDAVVVGSSLSAGGDVRVSAGRDANILGGTESSSHSKESFASGFGLGGSLGLDAGSLFVGYQQTLKGNAEARTTTAGSSLTASGDVRVSAGRNLNMTGSALTAGQDVNLAAGQDVNLLQATDASSVSAYERTLRAGLSLKLSQNLTGNARKAYADGGEAVDKAREGEVLGAAGKGYDAYSSAQSIANSKATASLSLGISSSWSSSESRSATAVPDKLAAGRDMRISAGRDLSLEGTQAVSGRDMRLEAGRDMDIRAAESREESSSRSGGVDASVGLSASVSKSGYTAGLSASVALKGADADAEGLRHTNAALTAGQTLSTQSGRDTGVRGANLDGKTVEMNVGRHLVVASLQDGTSARSSSVSAGGSASLSYGSGLSLRQNLNLGGSVADGSGKSVGRQTSIIGSEGLRIVTGRHTHLEGAVLAARNDDLLLDTGSLSFADLVGHTRQTSFSAGLTWGRSGKPGQPGNNAGISDDYGNGSPAKTDTSSAPAAQTQGKKPQTDLYDGAPTWMEDIVDTQQKWGKKWDTFKRDDLHNIAPDKLAYAATSSGQIARATIGAGEIRLRETPGQSLDGLNRDLSQTLLTEDRRETKVELQPLFSYVDKALNPTTTTNFFNGLHELGTDPGAFVAGLFGDLFGGKNDAKDATGSGKGGTGNGKDGTGNGKDGKDNSAAARAALQALCTDPLGFLKQAFPLLFSAPVSAQDAGR